MKSRMELLILAYNNEKIIGETLENIGRGIVGNLECRVLVLDNGSTDHTFSVVRSFPFVEAFRVEKNRFFSGGANLLFDRCENEHAFFMSSDVNPTPEALRAMIHFAESVPDAGIVGCRSESADGKLERTAKRDASPLLAHFQYGMLSLLRPLGRRVDRYYWYGNEGFPFAQPREVDVVQDSFIYIRGNLLRGGLRYDEEMKLFFTEDDLCQKARRLGYKVYFHREAAVRHWGQRTTDQNNGERQKIYWLDAGVYFRKSGVGKPRLRVLLGDCRAGSSLRRVIRKKYKL